MEEIKKREKQVEIKDKALLSITEFCQYTGIGRNNAFAVVGSPLCPFSFRIGKKLFERRALFDTWLSEHEDFSDMHD